MRFQHELLGQYEGYPPTIRRLLQSVFPFAAWSLSAARFTYWTMPLHRTAQTALLIKTQDVVAKQWADEHKDVPPGSLRTAARTKDGGFVDFARYTPYGFSAPIIEGDPSGVTDQFMPQASGFAAALSGLDPFGRPLQVPRTPSNPKGTPSLGQKVGAGFNSLAEGFVPYLSTLRRLREHGETPLSTSTAWSPKTKPGTSHGMSALRRTFDPFRPTYLRAAGGTARPVPGGRSSPQQQLLERAAERNANGGLSDAQLRLLERAAERAGG